MVSFADISRSTRISAGDHGLFIGGPLWKISQNRIKILWLPLQTSAEALGFLLKIVDFFIGGALRKIIENTTEVLCLSSANIS
jgi:hypothetical protein